MSENGELKEEAARIRQELIAIAKRMRALDERVRDVVNLQAGLKAAVNLSLDYLDMIEAKLRKS